MTTSPRTAETIARHFAEIRARGGRAAIDYKDGEIVLMCTRPTDNPVTWGKGATPAPWSDHWVRIAQA